MTGQILDQIQEFDLILYITCFCLITPFIYHFNLLPCGVLMWSVDLSHPVRRKDHAGCFHTFQILEAGSRQCLTFSLDKWPIPLIERERERNIEYLRYLTIWPRGFREVQIDLNLFFLLANFHILGPLSDSQCLTYWAKYQTRWLAAFRIHSLGLMPLTGWSENLASCGILLWDS